MSQSEALERTDQRRGIPLNLTGGRPIRHGSNSVRRPAKAVEGNRARYEDAYFQAFVLAEIICWSPFKALAYVAPFLILGLIYWKTGEKIVFWRTLKWFVCGSAIVFAYYLITSGFVFFSGLLTLITYGTFAFVWAVPGRLFCSRRLFERMRTFACWMILVQASLGIVQAAYGATQSGSFDLANGDYVEGTIHPALASEKAFANPMFAVNISILLLGLTPDALLHKKDLAIYGLGAFALLLASVMHVIGLAGVSALCALFLFRPRISRRAKAILAVACVSIGIAGGLLLVRNIRSAASLFEGFASGRVPKAIMVLRSITVIPEDYPRVPWVGLGPGQLTSRAGLIGTGYYLGGILDPKPVPLMPTGISEPQSQYLMDLWLMAASDPYASSTTVPYCSWISVFTEFGWLASIVVISCVAIAVFRLRKQTMSSDRLLSACTAAGIIFVFLLGVQENYWETTQVLLGGAMLLKCMHAVVVDSSNSAKSLRVSKTLNHRAIA